MIFESVQMREKLIWFLHYFIILEGVEKVKSCENTIPVILRNLNKSNLANMWLNSFDKNNKLESANVWLGF